MTAIIVFVVMLAALGAATVFGHVADSRDPEYGVGRIIDGPLRPAGR